MITSAESSSTIFASNPIIDLSEGGSVLKHQKLYQNINSQSLAKRDSTVITTSASGCLPTKLNKLRDLEM